MLSIQAFINMAVAVNLIPVTGQPLPLISRGGTSTLITCAYFGLILSADRFGIGKKKEEEVTTEITENVDETESKDDNDVDDIYKEEEATIALDDEVEFEIYKV